VCHQLHDNVEIPRHVSILPDQYPARGGYLGAQYDAFKTYDPIESIPDVTARVSPTRAARRLDDLTSVAATSFARGRITNLAQRPAHTRGRAAHEDAETLGGGKVDAVRAAKGFRRAGGARFAEKRIRGRAVRPRLPGRHSAHRSWRPLRRSHSRRLGHAHQ